jgi:hypothetical protein
MTFNKLFCLRWVFDVVRPGEFKGRVNLVSLEMKWPKKPTVAFPVAAFSI